MAVKVTFKYEPEPDEVDDHPTGLTDEAFMTLMDKIAEIGGTDVNAEVE